MSLHADVSTIEKLYENHMFRIPAYQREYVWERTHLRDLLDDIFAAEQETHADGRQHIIGNITTCRSAGSLDVIDGQQRLTTIFLILCALRDILVLTQDQEAVDDVNPLLVSRSGLRLTAARPDTAAILKKIQSGDTEDLKPQARAPRGMTREVKNIINNFFEARKYLLENLAGGGLDAADPDARRRVGARVVRFYRFFIDKVKAVLFEADNPEIAIRVFQTANTRGVSLSQIDLLKVDILGPVLSDARHGAQWDHILQEVKDRADAFLRYHVAVEYGDMPRKSQIYRWYCDQVKSGVIDFSDVTQVLARMRRNAELYAALSDHRLPDRAVPALSQIKAMGTNKRQHILLLMAGGHLDQSDPRLFDRLATEVEQLVFVSLIADDEPKEEEKRFTTWAKDLKTVRSAVDLEVFLDATLREHRSIKAAEFVRAAALQHTKAANGAPSAKAPVTKLMRYTLASIARHLDIIGRNSDCGFEAYYNLEVEHILPQEIKTAGARAFLATVPVDKMTDDIHDIAASSIANMSLLSKSSNSSGGARPFAEKASIYAGSGEVINILLAAPQGRAMTPSLASLAQRHPPFADWTLDTLDRRSSDIAEWARQIWVEPRP